jgi:ribosome-associated translation inhibitor RaiA
MHMVRLIGWRGLGISATEEEQMRVLINRHIQRLLLVVEDMVDVSIHVKQASKLGQRHRYEVHLTVLSEHNLYRAERGDWELRTAIHKAFESIELQAKKKHVLREHLSERFATSEEPLLRL